MHCLWKARPHPKGVKPRTVMLCNPRLIQKLSSRENTNHGIIRDTNVPPINDPRSLSGKR
eukprot:13537246-Ditylum_brightwellii.AAC.1